MDKELLKAAISGDTNSMKGMASKNPEILLGKTPQGNTCLHISSLCGHLKFCTDELKEYPTMKVKLLSVNMMEETPLLTAIRSGHVNLATFLLKCCEEEKLSEVILKQDKDECNALHHAIRTGHKDLALHLIRVMPTFSKAVHKFGESPMYIASMRDFNSEQVFEKLLETPDSAHSGAYGYNALHAAMRNGDPDIAKKIVVARPWLATERNNDGNTPMQLAVRWGKTDMLRVLLEHDRSLGYVVNSKNGYPLLLSAAHRGHVNVARELLKYCPDAPYCKRDGWTCLHEAVRSGNTEFVQFILGKPQLQKLINMRGSNGKTALHYAVMKCNPTMVAALLDKEIDLTILSTDGNAAAWELQGATDNAKTLNWVVVLLSATTTTSSNIYSHNGEVNEVSMLMIKADPRNLKSLYNLHEEAKGKLINASRKDAKFFTKKLMWFAYMETTAAFATGLYAVFAPRLLWLAVGICSVAVLVPILTKVLGEWPVLKLRIRVGHAFEVRVP
uniref:Uncharacterized protein n=1 Tax=Leersia perrieri TaxID=77586 RepID=A0A0D9XQX0_9ORYZ